MDSIMKMIVGIAIMLLGIGLEVFGIADRSIAITIAGIVLITLGFFKVIYHRSAARDEDN